MRAGGHLAALGDRHSLPRNSRVFHHERRETALRPSVLDAPQLLDAGEALVESADPAEACGDRVGIRPDVVAVKRIADLEPQCVPRAQAAGHCAALEHTIPQVTAPAGLHEQFAAALARVTGPVHSARDAVDLAVGEREGGRVSEAESL